MSQGRIADVQELKTTEVANPFYELFRILRNMVGITLVIYSILYGLFQIISFPDNAIIRLVTAITIVSIPCAAFFWPVSLVTGRLDVTNYLALRTYGVTLLTVSAVGVPLIYLFFQPDQWLSNESTFRRIIGYAATVGIIQELIKYVIVRYSVWDDLTERHLVLLHTISAALAVTCVISMTQYLLLRPQPDSFIIRVLLQFGINITGSLLISYGLIQLRSATLSLVTMPFLLVMASLVSGAGITFRSGLMNAAISVTGTNTRPLFALGFVILLTVGGMALGWFILTANDRKIRVIRMDTPVIFTQGVTTLSFRQRWSSYLVLITAFIFMGIGAGLQQQIINRTSLYRDTTTGITALYPADWLIDRNTEGTIFRVRNMRSTGFKTTVQVSILPIGTDTTERNIADRLAFERSQQLIDYRQLSVTPSVFRDNNAERVTYTFVSREASPFLESVPIVVIGEDIILFNRGQAIVFTFHTDAGDYAATYPVFEQFLEEVDF